MKTTTRYKPRGFTLVEVLVVVGIIALLVGVTLAALSGGVTRARTAACLSNQREAGAALFARANATGGWMPLAGNVVVPGDTRGYGSLPAALGDDGRRRYAYFDERLGGMANQAFERLVGGVPGTLGVRGGALAGPGGDWGVWRCPGRTPEARQRVGNIHQTLVFDGVPGNVVWANDQGSDYAFNLAVFGFDYRDPNGRRFGRGRLAAVRDTSERVLLADAESGPDTQLLVFGTDGTGGRVTLADTPRHAGTGRIAPERHGGRFVTLFADGHAEALTAADATRGVLTN